MKKGLAVAPLLSVVVDSCKRTIQSGKFIPGVGTSCSIHLDISFQCRTCGLNALAVLQKQEHEERRLL